MRSIRARAVLAMVGAILAGTSGAWAVPLSDLQANAGTENGLVVSGDKLFGNFRYTISGMGSYQADPAQIDVVPIQTNGDYGIRFLNPAVTAVLPILYAAPGNSYVDMLIEFDIVVLDRTKEIKDVSLGFFGYAPADGFAQVVESVSDLHTVVKQLEVQSPAPVTDHADLPATYKTLHIIKDIIVWGGAGTTREDAAVIWTIDQTFSQTPEPAAIALLGIGSLLMFPRVRRARGVLCVALLLIGMAGFAARDAKAVTLSTLADNYGSVNGGVVSGDKFFGNFKVTLATSGKTAVNTQAIEVIPITIGTEPGIRFAGAIAALSTIQTNSFVHMVIEFDAAVADPTKWLIDDVSLRFNGARTGPDALAQVTEQVFIPGTSTLLGTAFVQNAINQLKLNDHTNLLPATGYSVVHIVKTIDVSGGEAGLATISFIDQTFSQIQVPEPATAALLGLGALFAKRRRH